MPFVNLISEEEVSNEFIIEIDTGVSTTFHISKGMMTTDAQAQYIVDKGDGSQVTINGLADSNFDLTYASAGVYTVKIKPNAPTAEYLINFYDDDVDIDKLIKIQKFGFAELDTLWGAENLTEINDIPTLINPTAPNHLLRDCYGLTKIKNLELWTDWSSVTSASNAFVNLRAYNEEILISDLSSLEIGTSMFSNMWSYNHDFKFSSLVSLQNAENMFRDLRAYGHDFDLTTSSDLTNANWMFTNSGLISSIKISNCAGITTANDLLFSCEYITTLELHGFSIDLDISPTYLRIESDILALIASLKDLTMLSSKTLTHSASGWTSACASALAAKNWTD